MMSLGTLFLACQFADLLWPTLARPRPRSRRDRSRQHACHAAQLRQLSVLAQLRRARRLVGAVRAGVSHDSRLASGRDRHDRRAGLQPLRARRDHASARHADHAHRIATARTWAVELSGHHARDRVGAVHLRHHDLHERHARARSDRTHRALCPDRRHRRDLLRGALWPAAAQHCRHRDRRAPVVAVRDLGVLGGSAQGALADTIDA